MGHRVGAADSISEGERKHLNLEGEARVKLAQSCNRTPEVWPACRPVRHSVQSPGQVTLPGLCLLPCRCACTHTQAYAAVRLQLIHRANTSCCRWPTGKWGHRGSGWVGMRGLPVAPVQSAATQVSCVTCNKAALQGSDHQRCRALCSGEKVYERIPGVWERYCG